MCHFLTVFLLRRNVCPSPLSIFNWVIWSFHCCIMSSYIFWTFDPYQMYDLQIWSPILRDVFSLSFVLWSKKFLFCFLNFGDCNTYFSLIAYVSGLSNRPYLISMGFPGGSTGKEPACNEGDLGLIPGLGRSPGEGNGYSLQYSGLENSMDCIVHGVTKSRTGLSDFHFHTDHCLTQGHEDLCLCSLLEVTFRSLIQLEVLFLICYEERV